MKKIRSKGKVYLVGAGPGDPGLVTVKGLDIIRRADVIVHDYLANPRILHEADDECEIVFVGKRHDKHFMEQSEINKILVQLAKEHAIVVRLKGGDPFIFGRGGEEADALVDAGILFEVIPGVTSAVAVPSYAGIPLTHRDFASDVTFVTGHERNDGSKAQIDWRGLARGNGTLVFMMGIKNIEKISTNLIENGRNSCTPTAVIRWGTMAEQKVISGTLASIAVKVRKAELRPPAIIVIGEVVRCRDTLSWFDKKPLFGQKILITRPKDQSAELIVMLEDLGGEALEFPTIQTIPANDYTSLDNAIEQIDCYDWLIFTSANGVSYFIERLLAKGKDVRSLKDIKIATVGSATARKVRDMKIKVDLVPDDFVAEGLIKSFSDMKVDGKKMLLPRALKARELLPDELRKLGAKIEVAPAYETITAKTISAPIKKQLIEGRIDWITFTSASTVKNFIKIMDDIDLEELSKKVHVAAIGPITEKTAEKYGLAVEVTAVRSTNSGLVTAIANAVEKELARA